MQITVKPFENSFAAEIDGIDIQNGVNKQQFKIIHEAFLKHKVLIFRNQPLDDEAHQKFGMLFGVLDGHINKSTRHKALPSVQVFSNVKPNGETTGVHPEKGTQVWHTDKSYTTTPSLTTILRSPAIAQVGGDTLFADMTRAYNKLSNNMKTGIDNLFAVTIGFGVEKSLMKDLLHQTKSRQLHPSYTLSSEHIQKQEKNPCI